MNAGDLFLPENMTAEGVFVKGVPNEIFQNKIWPYLRILPEYFVLVPEANNSYYCVSKKWLQLKKPNLAELFYHYHIVKHQWHLICDDPREKLYEMLEEHRDSKSETNSKMRAYLRTSNKYIYDLISVCHLIICKSIYDFDEVDFLCKKIINNNIYYWGSFKFLLQQRYHATWLACYELALKKGIEDKRDLQAISNRYEYDLKQYTKLGNFDSRLIDSFSKIKNGYSLRDDCGNEEALLFTTIDTVNEYKFSKNKKGVEFFLNDFYLFEKNFGSYENFKNAEKVQKFYQENKDFISNFFYKNFKDQYNAERISLKSMNCVLSREYQNKSFSIDFLIYTKQYVLQAIASKILNDEQACFLLMYGIVAFNVQKRSQAQVVSLGILDLIQDFPVSFNNRCEDVIFAADNPEWKVLDMQKDLNVFRREQRKKGPEKFYDKLLSLRKIAFYYRVNLFGLFMSLFMYKTSQISSLKGFYLTIFLLFTLYCYSDVYSICRVRFVY